MDEDKIASRMAEILAGIDNAALLICADEKERLMLACCMLQKTSEIYESIIGRDGKMLMFIEAAMR